MTGRAAMTAEQPVAVVAAGSPLDVDEHTRAHPLATQQGVNLIMAMIEADRNWRPLTQRCRHALATAVHSAIATAKPGDIIPLPALPADTHPRTVQALKRRDYIEWIGERWRLTPLAVEIVQLAAPRDPRPTTTITDTRGRL